MSLIECFSHCQRRISLPHVECTSLFKNHTCTLLVRTSALYKVSLHRPVIARSYYLVLFVRLPSPSGSLSWSRLAPRLRSCHFCFSLLFVLLVSPSFPCPFSVMDSTSDDYLITAPGLSLGTSAHRTSDYDHCLALGLPTSLPPTLLFARVWYWTTWLDLFAFGSVLNPDKCIIILQWESMAAPIPDWSLFYKTLHNGRGEHQKAMTCGHDNFTLIAQKGVLYQSTEIANFEQAYILPHLTYSSYIFTKIILDLWYLKKVVLWTIIIESLPSNIGPIKYMGALKTFFLFRHNCCVDFS